MTTRRAKLGAKLAEVGVASDEGQRILEAAGAREARGRKLDLDEAGEIRTEPAPDGHARAELIADFAAAKARRQARGRKPRAEAVTETVSFD